MTNFYDMPTITTPSGYKILVDKDVAEWASTMSWNVSPRGYARTWVKTGTTKKYVHMHRLVLNAKAGEIVDHINRNKLDNRRKNLRIASAKLNAINRRSQGSSRFKGVAKHSGGWQVYVGGKYVGIFAEEKSAAVAYDTAAKQLYGRDAVTNKKLGLL